MSQPIKIVLGGQFGSEGKGLVSRALCQMYGIDYTLRVVGYGEHPAWGPTSQEVKLRALPTASILPSVTPVVRYIGGGEIPWQELEREVAVTGCKDRLLIDRQGAVVHSPGLNAEEWLASLGRQTWVANLVDTADVLTDAYREGKKILVETGRMVAPNEVHRCDRSARAVYGSGLSPALDYEVILAVRTMPMVRDGAKGYMRYHRTWQEVLAYINQNPDRTKDHNLDELCSTPGNYVPGWLDPVHVRRMCRLEGAGCVALTFLNWMHPETWHSIGPYQTLPESVKDYVARCSRMFDCPVRYVSTGPRPEHVLLTDQ